METSIQVRLSRLSPRQRQVLRLIALGCKAQEIGAILGISEDTANCHIAAIKYSLGITRPALLTRLTIENKIFFLDDELSISEQRKAGRRIRSTELTQKPLTERQKRVVRLLSLGCTSKQIANILGIKVTTVYEYRDIVHKRLGTSNQSGVTREAIKLGITSLADKLTPTEKRTAGLKDDGWN